MEVLDARVPELVLQKVRPVVDGFAAIIADKWTSITNWFLEAYWRFDWCCTNLWKIVDFRSQNGFVQFKLNLVIVNIFMGNRFLREILAGRLRPLLVLLLGNDAALAELNSCLQIAQANHAHVVGQFFLAT